MEESSLNNGGDASQLSNGSFRGRNTAIDLKASAIEPENDPSGVKPETPKAEGSRSFTMRELLKELKEDGNGSGSEANRNDESPSFSSQQQHVGQTDTSMELINNIDGGDEESRSRQRILAFAAKRYANAIERNPDDHDAYYNWALVLQEGADTVNPESGSTSKDALLEEACKKYDKATQLCPTLHDAFYNWAIAISDRAKLRGRTKEAEELWKQATQKYEKAVQLNWNSPQALNNWGLALQELSAIVSVREKATIVRSAISKFRAAVQLQFDFHRAIYNLGTVLYGLAEDTLRLDRQLSSRDISPGELYSQSAIYIAAAHALKPNYSVYRSALRLVRTMLPIPYLKVGYLTTPPASNPVAPHTDWERSQFVLNHEGLQQVTQGDRQLSQNTSGRFQGSPQSDKLIKVYVPDIVSVTACADLTLPPDAGLCIDTVHGPVFLCEQPSFSASTPPSPIPPPSSRALILLSPAATSSTSMFFPSRRRSKRFSGFSMMELNSRILEFGCFKAFGI